MKNSSIMLSVDKQNIPIYNIIDFQFTSDIRSCIPRGFFVLRDEGERLYNLQFKIGSLVAISIVDTKGNLAEESAYGINPKMSFSMGALASPIKTQLCPCYVTNVEYNKENFLADNSEIKVYFAYQWEYYKDFTNHVYAPMKISALFKEVLTKRKSRFKFESGKEVLMLDETTDSGELPRYKSNESDIDFLLNKALPYAKFGDYPAYFFLDDYARVYLKPFNSMFSASPKCNFILRGEMPVSTPVNPSMGAKDLEACFLSIGTSSEGTLMDKLKLGAYLEDQAIGHNYFGIKEPTSKCGEDLGGGILPFSVEDFMSTLQTNDATPYNKSFADGSALITYQQRDLDEMFTFAFVSEYCGEYVSVGDTISLTVSNQSKIPMGTSFWLNDTWLVSKLTHTRKENETVVTQLEVIRPTITSTILGTLEYPLLWQTLKSN